MMMEVNCSHLTNEYLSLVVTDSRTMIEVSPLQLLNKSMLILITVSVMLLILMHAIGKYYSSIDAMEAGIVTNVNFSC